jgi:hypothetical protein
MKLLDNPKISTARRNPRRPHYSHKPLDVATEMGLKLGRPYYTRRRHYHLNAQTLILKIENKVLKTEAALTFPQSIIIGVVSIELPHFRRNLPNSTTLRFDTKIYHFLASRLQFGQITDLEPIDSESDIRDPLVSAEVAKIKIFSDEVDVTPHVSPIKTIKKKNKNYLLPLCSLHTAPTRTYCAAPRTWPPARPPAASEVPSRRPAGPLLPCARRSSSSLLRQPSVPFFPYSDGARRQPQRAGGAAGRSLQDEEPPHCARQARRGPEIDDGGRSSGRRARACSKWLGYTWGCAAKGPGRRRTRRS